MTDTTTTPGWVDPIPVETQALTAQWLLECQQAHQQCWVLIDRGFASASEWKTLQQHYAPTLVYTGRLAGADTEPVAPHWVAVPRMEQADQLQRWLTPLYTACQGRPMLSYLISPADRDLRTWLNARTQLLETDSQTHYIARWADTRCLPQLLSVLTPSQQRWFVDGIYDWRYHNRQGLLCSVLPPNLPDTLNSEWATWQPPLGIDTQQAQQLNSLAMPDTVFAYLKQKPTAFGQLCGQSSAIYACIQQVLQHPETGSSAVTHEQLQTLLQALQAQQSLKVPHA